MSDFVYDVTAQPSGKQDSKPLVGPVNQSLVAAEWNTTAQNIIDLRNAITNGRWHALQSFGAAPVSGPGQAFMRYNGSQFGLSQNAGIYRDLTPQYINPLDHGADSTGVADSTAAFTAALAAGGKSPRVSRGALFGDNMSTAPEHNPRVV